MDPLSIASSIVGIISAANATLGMFGRGRYKQDRLNDALHSQLRRFKTATALLMTVGTHLPTTDVIPGVDLCLQICVDSQRDVEEMAQHAFTRSGNVAKRLWMAGSTHSLKEKLIEAVDRFVGAVELLRSFSQEARSVSTFMAIRELEFVSKFGFECQTDSMRKMSEQGRILLDQMSTVMKLFGTQAGNARNTDPIHRRATDDDSSQIGEQLSQIRSRLEDIHRESDKRQKDTEKLWGQLQSSFAGQGPLEFNQSNGFVYTISILGLKDNEQDPSSSTRCRATLDTGCDGNWVATWIVEKAGLQGSIKAKQESHVFQSFSGHTMEPQGQIELTFFMDVATRSSQKTRTESFYVYAELPVELVLGKDFIEKDAPIYPPHPKQILGLLKLKRPTPEENEVIEASRKTQALANAEIIAHRVAAGKSAREIRRRQKAQSGATTSGASTPNSGSPGRTTQPAPYPKPFPQVVPGSQWLVKRSGGNQSAEARRSVVSDSGDDEVQEPDVEAGPSRGS